MLVGGAIGDEPHEPGDTVDAPEAQAKRWVKAGIAEEITGRKANKTKPDDDEEDA